jgi:hypothetical protein
MLSIFLVFLISQAFYSSLNANRLARRSTDARVRLLLCEGSNKCLRKLLGYGDSFDHLEPNRAVSRTRQYIEIKASSPHNQYKYSSTGDTDLTSDDNMSAAFAKWLLMLACLLTFSTCLAVNMWFCLRHYKLMSKPSRLTSGCLRNSNQLHRDRRSTASGWMPTTPVRFHATGDDTAICMDLNDPPPSYTILFSKECQQH